uniref:Uncharacterized protein n=1 Tax=Anguilla anguilla TaxID=7936 RepID=A0A0E9X5E2_ANGAN
MNVLGKQGLCQGQFTGLLLSTQAVCNLYSQYQASKMIRKKPTFLNMVQRLRSCHKG